jgi:hypothetical protein
MALMESLFATHTSDLLASYEDAEAGYGDDVRRDVLVTRLTCAYEHPAS